MATFAGCRVMSTESIYESGAGTLYFPTYDDTYHRGIDNRPDDSLSSFVNNWYSKHLYTLGEPVIYNQADHTKNIIRFTYLPTWGNPVAYRLEQNGTAISVTYNKTNGFGGYGAGRRTEHKTKKIDKGKWDRIVAKIDAINFWDIETHEKEMILDGVEWILEVSMNGRYHFVTRNSPDYDGGEGYAELCNLVVQAYKEK